MLEVQIRSARHEDLGDIQQIEFDSGQRFRDFGLPDVADNEPTSIAVLRSHLRNGRAWVALGDGGRVIGFLLLGEIDGAAHVEQVSVSPNDQGKGVGQSLIGEAARWAMGRGMSALTLTTFGHIPWNRPLYEHLGFRVLSEDELGVGLRAVCDSEAELGLDPELRVAMRLDLQH
jgi:ribosomal protein S18 acetylase RimI-like enzyme